MPVVRIWRRGGDEPPREPERDNQATPAESEESTAVAGNPEWDMEVRPRRSVLTARIVAGALAALFIVGGILLRTGSTGVSFRLADQIAMIAIGLLLAGGVLLLTRPRVRVGPSGVVVRNIFGDNEFQWKDIRGVSFQDKKAWARLELVHDEYVPMLAFRANDKIYAVEAMDRFRDLGAKYTAGQGS